MLSDDEFSIRVSLVQKFRPGCIMNRFCPNNDKLPISHGIIQSVRFILNAHTIIIIPINLPRLTFARIIVTSARQSLRIYFVNKNKLARTSTYILVLNLILSLLSENILYMLHI